MCRKGCCGDEFHLRNFKLWHGSREDLTNSKWVPLPVLVLFRFLLAAFNVGVWIYNVLVKIKFAIFFTNWFYTVFTLYFSLAFIFSFMQCLREKKQSHVVSPDKIRGPTTSEDDSSSDATSEEEPLSHPAERDEEQAQSKRIQDALRPCDKFLWLLFNLSFNLSLLVTIGYWTVIYEKTDVIDASSITKHGLVSAFIVFDLLLSGVPVRVYHFVYTTLFIVVYLVFSIAYWQAGGTNDHEKPYIYKALDYNNMTAASATIVAFFFFIIVPVLQMALFGIYKLRTCLTEK